MNEETVTMKITKKLLAMNIINVTVQPPLTHCHYMISSCDIYLSNQY